MWKSQKNSKGKLVNSATQVGRLQMRWSSVKICTDIWPFLKVQSRSLEWINVGYGLERPKKIGHMLNMFMATICYHIAFRSCSSTKLQSFKVEKKIAKNLSITGVWINQGGGVWSDRDTNDIFAYCSFFYFLDFKFSNSFVLLIFILWCGSFKKIPSEKRIISENHPKCLSS